MSYKEKVAGILSLVSVFTAFGQHIDLFNGIQLKESLESVREKVAPYANDLNLYTTEAPTFPLAREHENHLVIQGFESGGGRIAEVVFTFADDELVFIQAYGNAVSALTGQRKDTAQTYGDYVGYWKDLVIAKPREDKVWILTPEAAHPNLFTWDNPFLPVNKDQNASVDPSIRIPEYLKMGATLEEVRPALEKASRFTYIQELAGDDPNAQLQIDCFGVPFAGFPRKFEARFGAGKLNMVWILTGKGEEDRLRNRLVQEYGPALYSDEAWEAYNNWQVMLRKDKPELLLLTKELAELYRKDYFGQED